jgi:hypothetical protein
MFMKPQASSSKIWIIAVAGAVVLGASVWGITSFAKRTDASPTLPPELTVEGLKAQRGEPGKLMEVMRGAMDREDLTEEQRRQIRENMREVMQSTMRERVDEYFNASEDEKQAVLDRHIDEFQQIREQWERRAKEREKETDEQRKAREDRRGGRSAPTQEERKARSESRNPDQMARGMAYFGAMQARMAERGIKSPGPGFGPGGGGRGGPGRFGP